MKELAWDLVEWPEAPYWKMSLKWPFSMINILRLVHKLIEKFHHIEEVSIQYKSAFDPQLINIHYLL